MALSQRMIQLKRQEFPVLAKNKQSDECPVLSTVFDIGECSTYFSGGKNAFSVFPRKAEL